MTNCCDEYGDCRQGRDCPARTGVVLPHQAAHQKMCEENNRPSESASISPEAGNVWFVGAEPDESVPVTPFEAIFFYLCIAIGAVSSLVVIAGAAGWIYERFFN